MLGCFGLTGVAIGSTIASAVFSLSGDMAAAGAGTGAVLVGWLLCGSGMMAMVLCFFQLNKIKPELKGGIYSYARAGFGDYIGFQSVWGFWISNFLANVSFAALMFSAAGRFFPLFGAGNNLASTVGASVLTWGFALLVKKGVKAATLINLIVTLAKLVPILIFIMAVFFFKAFDPQIFFMNFMGQDTGLPFGRQVAATAYTTAWAFIGVEGAVVISGRARNMADVGRATMISYLGVLVIYVMVSVLSMGVMTRGQLAQLGNPPLADILTQAAGPWGGALINGGVIIALLGATLGHVIICTECIYEAASSGSFCRAFAATDKKGTPVFALLVTSGLVQIFLILSYFQKSTYQAFYGVATSMMIIPYLLTALYYRKLISQNTVILQRKGIHPGGAKITAGLGILYGLWLLYSGGIDNLLVTALLYAPGTLIYIKGKREQGQRAFSQLQDKAALAVLFLLAAISLVTKGFL